MPLQKLMVQYIQNNAALESINGFNSLTGLNGSINIKSNAALQRINGFNAANNIGNIVFDSNNSLTDIEGFSTLSGLNSLSLLNNAALQNINGFGAISSHVTGGIDISNNPMLSACNLPFICGTIKIYLNVTIANNSGNCLNSLAVINACNFPCSVGDQTFSTQHQVDSFANLYIHCDSIIANNVTISGSDITDLSRLDKIRRITGSLNIVSNNSLASLIGLLGINSVGGALTIQSNNALTNLDLLSGITSIGGNFIVQSNAALTNLNAFPNLKTVGGDFTIQTNPALTNLNGFPVLAGIGGTFNLKYNGVLNSFTGLSKLTNIGAGFTILSNAALPNLYGLSGLKSIGGPVTIDTNIALVNITGLSNLNNIDGHFTIRGNNVLSNLNGLSALTKINGDLEISSNVALTNVNDLSNIDSVRGFVIVHSNPVLTTLRLQGVKSIGSYLFLQNNAALTTLALSNLKTIGGYLRININASLVNLDSLSALQSLGGELVIFKNAALTSISGLYNLQTIKKRLEITLCDTLTSLDGLQNLTNIGFSDGEQLVGIYNNKILNNIEGIKNINPDSISQFDIINNPQLAICNYPNICTYLSYNPSVKLRTILNNSTTCLSTAEVIDASSDSSLLICPNGSTTLNSSLTGTNYQWQVNSNNGNGFTNISNGTNYSGAGTSQLQLFNMPTSLYGARFRCLVNGNYTSSIQLKFGVTWTGQVGSSWEAPFNWGCNVLPDANTDVVVPPDTNILQLNSIVTVRSFKAIFGSTFIAMSGSHLYIVYP